MEHPLFAIASAIALAGVVTAIVVVARCDDERVGRLLLWLLVLAGFVGCALATSLGLMNPKVVR